MADKTVLWWGRLDPGYSRNRILRRLLVELGWRIRDFHPLLSRFGDLEAALRRIAPPDLVWIPCFRQRDAAAAARWASRRGVPVVFDPLISAWDKQVFEHGKFGEESPAARKLLAWERNLFTAADLLLADTPEHSECFQRAFDLPADRIAVVPVGAEEPMFGPGPLRERRGAPLHILFYGSFIGLQEPEAIVDAARQYKGAPAHWYFVGDGPLLERCRERAVGVENVTFEPWLPYERLPERIRDADILLGVFGGGEKAGRVIPNKVYQSMACGRPVITRAAKAYPHEISGGVDGLAFVPPADPRALAAAVALWADDANNLAARGASAAETYRRYFSNDVIREELRKALSVLGLET